MFLYTTPKYFGILQKIFLYINSLFLVSKNQNKLVIEPKYLSKNQNNYLETKTKLTSAADLSYQNILDFSKIFGLRLTVQFRVTISLSFQTWLTTKNKIK